MDPNILLRVIYPAERISNRAAGCLPTATPPLRNPPLPVRPKAANLGVQFIVFFVCNYSTPPPMERQN